MFSFRSLVLFAAATFPLAAQTCNLAGPPVITNVNNGAAFRDFGFSINGLATIFGTGFQPVAQLNSVGAGDLTTGTDGIVRFPTVFRCVAVEVNGTRAPMLYTEPAQINFQIPSINALGKVNVVVILNPGGANEMRSNAWSIQMDPAGPGVFRFGITECVAALFPDGTPAADPVFVPGIGAKIPKIGDIVTIYVTGLGTVAPFWQAGAVPTAAANASNVQVMFNGTIMAASDVLYAGLSPYSISGLYQINIRVPTNANHGNNAFVVVASAFSSQDGVVLPVQ